MARQDLVADDGGLPGDAPDAEDGALGGVMMGVKPSISARSMNGIGSRSARHAGATDLLVTTDGGDSNSSRSRRESRASWREAEVEARRQGCGVQAEVDVVEEALPT